MALPPAVYSLLMFFTAAAFGYALSKRDLHRPAVTPRPAA